MSIRDLVTTTTARCTIARVELFVRKPYARVFLLAVMFFNALVSNAANIEYVYDDLGRLVAAVESGANKITYAYDANGNLASVTTAPASQVSVLNFLPKQGPVGSLVTIYGSGFSATPASNTVKINGVTALVTSSTVASLVVTVPVGAATGPINVTTPTGTATSTTSFVVGNVLPVISSFTPAIGYVGWPVTLSGTNFDALPRNNRVEFNGTLSSVTSVTVTSLASVVPTNAGSGPIRLTTPAGSVQSSADFFVAPATDSPANITTTGRINIGSSASASFAAGKAALYLFNGIAKQLLTVGVSGVTSTNMTVSILNPDGSTLATGTFGTAGGGLQLPPLSKSGVYTVYVKAVAAGNATITIAPPLTGTLTVGGAPLSLNITPPGRRALISFSGTAGQAVDLAMTGVTLSASRVSILKPDGSELIAASVTTAGGILRPALPEAGEYTIKVDPTGSIGGAVTLTLSASPMPPLTVNGATNTVSISTAGQVGFITFSGTAGQFLNVAVAEPCTTTTVNATVSVLSPNGATMVSVALDSFVSFGCSASTIKQGSVNLGLPSLPMSGTYTVKIQPSTNGVGTFTVSLTSGIIGAVAVNSQASYLAAYNGQGMQLTFTGSAGQYLSVGVSHTCDYYYGFVATVLKPDGTTLSTTSSPTLLSVGCSSSANAAAVNLNLPVLPVSGTYTVLVQPAKATRLTFTVSLAGMAPGNLAINGASVASALSIKGQGAQLTFSGTATQNLALTVTSTCSSIKGASISVLKQDNTWLSSGTLPATACTEGYFGTVNVNIATLPVTGIYTVFVQQTTAGTGTLTSTLKTR